MIKTVILTILVGLSLLLTFSLWNSQPNHDDLSNIRSEYVNEVDIGGTEETKKTIIKPTSIIFHKDHHYFGFADPLKQQRLYKKMQEWVLDDFKVSSAQDRPLNKYQVEVIFPTALPIEVI